MHIIAKGDTEIYVYLLDMVWLLVRVCINNTGWVD